MSIFGLPRGRPQSARSRHTQVQRAYLPIFMKKMISLLINTPNFDAEASCETRFGGQPSAPGHGFKWPTCRTCHGNMQFLGQLGLKKQSDEESLLLLFMCQNNPGLCDEWDANAGGNAVISVDHHSLNFVEPPEDGEVIRPTVYGARIVDFESKNYDEAREEWSTSTGVSAREVLGQIAGEPSWIQGEEVPSCDTCHDPMSFVAQLEQGPDWRTAMNFGGGGCAYVYRCTC